MTKPRPRLDRKGLLMISEAQIELLVQELTRPRVLSPGSDTTRIAYHRALSQAMGVHASILRDVDLDQMKKELELLREAVHAERHR